MKKKIELPIIKFIFLIYINVSCLYAEPTTWKILSLDLPTGVYKNALLKLNRPNLHNLNSTSAFFIDSYNLMGFWFVSQYEPKSRPSLCLKV